MTWRDRLLPWWAFLLGGFGWAVSQQWGSDRVTDHCLEAWPWQNVAIGLLGLLLAGVGAALSLAGLRSGESPAARFIARVSLAADAVFVLAILFHTAATLLIPRCFS